MSEPLSLAAVKANLRIDTDADDELIEGLIVDARAYVEGETGLVLTPRSITETTRCLGSYLDLTSWPVVSVDAIRYPVAGVMISLPVGAWCVGLKRRPVRVLPVSLGWGAGPWRIAGAQALPVEIDITAGYATSDDVPAVIKRAMHMLIGHWYANGAVEVGSGAAAIEVPFGVKDILDRWRMRYL